MVRFDERGAHFAQQLSCVSASGRPQDQLEVEQGIPKHIPNYHQGNIFSSPPPASEATVRSQKQSLPSQIHDLSIKEVSRSYFTGSPDQEAIRYGNCTRNLKSQGLLSFTNKVPNHQQSITSIRNDITNPDLKVNPKSTAIPDQQTQTQQELLYLQQLHQQEQLKLTQIQGKLELQRINQQKRQQKELQQQQIQQQRLQQEQQLKDLQQQQQQQQQQLEKQQKLAELEQEDIVPILEDLLIQSNSIFQTKSTTLISNMHSNNSQSSSQVQPSDRNENTNNEHNFPQDTEELNTSNFTIIQIPMLSELHASQLSSSVTPHENSLSISQANARSFSFRKFNAPVPKQFSDGQSDFTNSNNIYPNRDTGSLQNNQAVNRTQISGTSQVSADRTPTGTPVTSDQLQHRDSNHLQELIEPSGGSQTPKAKKRGRPRTSKVDVNISQIPPKVQKIPENDRQGRSDSLFPPYPAGGYPQYSGYLQQPSGSTQQFRCAQQAGSGQQSGYAQHFGYVQQAGYAQQSTYPQQSGYSQPRYSQQTSGYPQQLPGYSQYFEYPQQISRYTQQLPGYTKPILKPDSRQLSRLENLPGTTHQLPQFSGSMQLQHQNMQQLPQSMEQLPQNKQQFPKLGQQLPKYFQPLPQQFPQYFPQFPSFHQELFKHAQEATQYRRHLPQYADRPSTSNQQLTSQIHGYPELAQFCTQNSQICSQGKQLFADQDIPAQSESFPAQNQHVLVQSQQIHCQSQQVQRQQVPAGSQRVPFQSQQVTFQRQKVPSQSQQIVVQSQLVRFQTQQALSRNQQVLLQSQQVPVRRQKVSLQTQEIPFQSQQISYQNQQVLIQSQPVPVQNQEAPIQSQQILDQIPQYPTLTQQLQTQQIPNQNQPFSEKLKRLLEETHLSSPIQRLCSPTQRSSTPIQCLSSPVHVSGLLGQYLSPLQLIASPAKHPSTRAEHLPKNCQQFSPIDPNFQSKESPKEALEVSNEEPPPPKPKFCRSWHIPEDLSPSENRLESSECIESSLVKQPDEIQNSEETLSLSVDQNYIVFKDQQLPSSVEVDIETWVPTMPLDTASRMHDFEEELQNIGLQETRELQETQKLQEIRELQDTQELQETRKLQETNELQQQDSQQTNELEERNKLEQEQIFQVPVSHDIITISAETVETRDWILQSPPQLVIDSPTETEKSKGTRFKSWSYKPHKSLKATINRYRAKGITIRSPPKRIYLKETAKNKDITIVDLENENDENYTENHHEGVKNHRHHQDALKNDHQIAVNRQVATNSKMQEDKIKPKNSPPSRKENANSSKAGSETSNTTLPTAQNIINDRRMSREFTPSEIHHNGLPNLQRLLLLSDCREKERIKKKKAQEDQKNKN